MDHFYKNRKILEFQNLESFADDLISDEFSIPNTWAGTGHVIYNRKILYPKYNSNLINKYDLDKRKIQGSLELPKATLIANAGSYQWRGSTDIDLAIDETGIWAIYSTEASNGYMVLSKIDADSMKFLNFGPKNHQKIKMVTIKCNHHPMQKSSHQMKIAQPASAKKVQAPSPLTNKPNPQSSHLSPEFPTPKTSWEL